MHTGLEKGSKCHGGYYYRPATFTQTEVPHFLPNLFSNHLPVSDRPAYACNRAGEHDPSAKVNQELGKQFRSYWQGGRTG